MTGYVPRMNLCFCQRCLMLLMAGLTVAAILGAREREADAAAGDCAPWDVRDYCCPLACAVKTGPHWPEADRVLRACMGGFGCDDPHATVAARCECPR